MCCRATKTAQKRRHGLWPGKQHHKLYSSSNFEKNDVIYKKQVKTLKLTPTQLEKIPRCCRFLLRKHFCDQKLYCIVQSILHFHTAPWQEWMVSGQMMLKTLLTP
jgi:hypothetical protein